MRLKASSCALLLCAASSAAHAADDWYTQADFKPARRLAIRVTNDLDVARKNSPVTITSAQLPQIRGAQELTVTLVDPAAKGRPNPDAKTAAMEGAHGFRGETNGRALFYQLDDLNKDGIWDELFFMADLGPKETKTFYIYLGFQQRGWNPSGTFAGIGSYMRHVVPFWESAHVGWKLWFPTDIDVYAKRKGMLMAHRLATDNLDGYAVSLTNPDYGGDIQSVDDSFGGGGIGLFETPGSLTLSRPRFTPNADTAHRFNGDQLADTRYSFDVVVNGPLRSIIRINTFNWNSGQGRYALEQLYTSYSGESYTTAEVRFSQFSPEKPGAEFAAGVRKRPGEDMFFQEGGIVISTAPELIRNPDDRDGIQPPLKVAYAGSAIVVRDSYGAKYTWVPAFKGNHSFRFPHRPDNRYEYLLANGWSEGEVLKTAAEFRSYVTRVAREYNSPVRFVDAREESR